MKSLAVLILAFCQLGYSDPKCDCKEDSLIINQLSVANAEVSGKYIEANDLCKLKNAPSNITNNLYGPSSLSIHVKNEAPNRNEAEKPSEVFLFVSGLISGLGLGIFIFVISTGK